MNWTDADANFDRLLLQVTADLYGIYLVVYTHHSGREGTPFLPVIHELYTSMVARGSYITKHRFLRYTDNRHYQPIVRADDPCPSEYRAPKLAITRGADGINDPNMDPEEVEGINHPWQKPYPDVPVPKELVPTPIITLLLKDVDEHLSKILWVNLGDPDCVWPSTLQLQTPESIRLGNSQTAETQESGANNGATINMRNEGVSSVSNTGDVENPTPEMLALLPSTLPTPNCFQKPLQQLEKLVSERDIKIPKNVRNLKDLETRRKRYAAYLEGTDVENANRGRRVPDIIDFADGARRITGDETTTQISTRQERSGGVLRQITTTTATRTVTSVPSTIIPAQSETVPQTISLYRPLVDYQEIHLNTDEQLQQVLLGARLDVTGDRETDIETYRAWIKDNPNRPLNKYTSLAKVQAENEGGASGEGPDRFNTTINVNIYSGTNSQKRKQPPPSPEIEHFVPNPVEEDTHLEVEEAPSSPEPESPLPNDYSCWSAAALKRDAAARKPPVKVPAKQKAAETQRLLPPKLQELDDQARAARNAVRTSKRGERSAKRIKLIVKDNRKGGRCMVEEDDGGEGEESFNFQEQREGDLRVAEEGDGGNTQGETGDPAPEEAGGRCGTRFCVRYVAKD